MDKLNYETYIRGLFNEVCEECDGDTDDICIEIEAIEDSRTARTFRVSTEEASAEVVVYKDVHRQWGVGRKYAREALEEMLDGHIEAKSTSPLRVRDFID